MYLQEHMYSWHLVHTILVHTIVYDKIFMGLEFHI